MILSAACSTDSEISTDIESTMNTPVWNVLIGEQRILNEELYNSLELESIQVSDTSYEGYSLRSVSQFGAIDDTIVTVTLSNDLETTVTVISLEQEAFLIVAQGGTYLENPILYASGDIIDKVVEKIEAGIGF